MKRFLILLLFINLVLVFNANNNLTLTAALAGLATCAYALWVNRNAYER